MYIFSVLLLVALTLASSLQKPQRKCYKGVYIITPPPHHIHSVGIMHTTVNNVSARIPDSGVFVVQYDTESNDYPVTLPQGQAAAVKEILGYHKDCPKGTIAVMGLSEGGIVSMNTVCGNRDGTNQLPISILPYLVGVIGYGEEFFVPNQPYDYGTCTGQGPADGPRPNPQQCDPFKSVTRSYCDVEDPRCCNGTGGFAAHVAYPGKYDRQVATFIQNNYLKALIRGDDS